MHGLSMPYDEPHTVYVGYNVRAVIHSHEHARA